MTAALPDKRLAKIVWDTMGVHARDVHGGKPDEQCNACTQLLGAIGEIEALLRRRTDDRTS